MRIRIACGLDLRPLAGFWKNDRAVRAVRKIKYNSLLFYLLFIIFIIYYSSDSPSSLITESVCLVGKGRLKERCGLEPRTNFFFVRLRNRQKLVRIRFGCGLDSRIYGIHTVSLYCTRTVHSVPCQVYRPSSVHDSRQAAMWHLRLYIQCRLNITACLKASHRDTGITIRIGRPNQLPYRAA